MRKFSPNNEAMRKIARKIPMMPSDFFMERLKCPKNVAAVRCCVACSTSLVTAASSKMHDGNFSRFVGVELPCDTTFMHDENAIG